MDALQVLAFLGFIALLLVAGARIGASWARTDHRHNFMLTDFDRQQRVNNAADVAADSDDWASLDEWWAR